MKRIVLVGAALAAFCAAVAQTLPDVRRYIRMRNM
jgi:hypothetical protein